MAETRVRGEILFGAPPPSLAGARIIVRLENVSRADAPASVAAEKVWEGPGGPWPTGAALPFNLPVPAVNPGASYTIRVLIDVDRDGRLGQGDYISTESYPVLTYGQPQFVRVTVKRLGGK
jgi:uncharacterized lipoprotein YbaY